MKNGIELMMIECENCKQVFWVENKTGENICPDCGTKNERYIFDEDVDSDYMDLVAKLYEEMNLVLLKNNIEISSLELLDFIVKNTKNKYNLIEEE